MRRHCPFPEHTARAGEEGALLLEKVEMLTEVLDGTSKGTEKTRHLRCQMTMRHYCGAGLGEDPEEVTAGRAPCPLPWLLQVARRSPFSSFPQTSMLHLTD